MSPEEFAFGVAVAVFAAGAIGLFLQHLLPDRFTTGGPRDMIGAVVGLLTLLSALVLGLLIWTAYSVYSGQNLAVQTLAAKDLQLDLALADYGPDATPLRTLIREQIGKTIDQIWRADASDGNFVATISPVRSKTSAAVRRGWTNFIPQPTTRSRRWRPRARQSTRSPSRACRCRLR